MDAMGLGGDVGTESTGSRRREAEGASRDVPVAWGLGQDALDDAGGGHPPPLEVGVHFLSANLLGLSGAETSIRAKVADIESRSSHVVLLDE